MREVIVRGSGLGNYAEWVLRQIGNEKRPSTPESSPNGEPVDVKPTYHVGAHVKVNKSEQRPVWGAIIIIAGGGFGFDIIAA